MGDEKLPRIRFYDVASADHEPHSWSPFCTRAALCLRIRRLPFERVPLPYPDIAPTLGGLGVPPTAPDASGVRFTCPAIQLDDAVPFMESEDIARELDKLVPHSPAHPALFPTDESLKSTEQVKEGVKAVVGSTWAFVTPLVPRFLDPRGKKYFLETRRIKWGREADEIAADERPGDFVKAIVPALVPLAKTYAKAEAENGGPFISGKEPTFPDTLTLGLIRWYVWARGTIGKEDEFLQLVREAEGGALGRLWEASQELLASA